MQTLFEIKQKKQKYVRNSFLRIVFLFSSISTILFFSSCAVKKPVSPLDPLGVLGPQTSTYFVIPVVQNKAFLNLIASEIDESDSFRSALDRTEIVYAGLSPIKFSDVRIEREASLLALGAFPKAASPLVFPKNKGWKKVSEKYSGTWYSSGTIEAAIPESGMLLASTSNLLHSLLVNRHSPEAASVSQGFSLFADHAREDGRLGVYFSNPTSLVQLIFGSELSFPIENIEVYATPPILQATDESVYLINARVTLDSSRSARVFSSILRFTLNIPSLQNEETIIISDFPVKQESLVDFVKNMYFLF